MGGEADRQRVAEEQEADPSPLFTSSSSSSHPSSCHRSTSSSCLGIKPREEELIPPDLHALFAYYNDTYFRGALSAVEVRWSKRMTLCAGLCVYQRRGGYCSVRLSEPLLKFRSVKEFRETLLHEMIHAFLFVTAGNDKHEAHGPEFLAHMYRLNRLTGLNITVYHNFHDEVNHYRTHIWRCQGKCRQQAPYFGYVRRAMNRAPGPSDRWWAEHQATCGGVYVKVAEPQIQNRRPALLSRAPIKHQKTTPASNGLSLPALWRAQGSRKGGHAQEAPRDAEMTGQSTDMGKDQTKTNSSGEPSIPPAGLPFHSPGSLADIISRRKHRTGMPPNDVLTKSESQAGSSRQRSSSSDAKVDNRLPSSSSSSSLLSPSLFSVASSSVNRSPAPLVPSGRRTSDQTGRSDPRLGKPYEEASAVVSSFSDLGGSTTSSLSSASSRTSSASSSSAFLPEEPVQFPLPSSLDSSDEEVQILGIRRGPAPGSPRPPRNRARSCSSAGRGQTRSRFSEDSDESAEASVVLKRGRTEEGEEPGGRQRMKTFRRSPSQTSFINCSERRRRSVAGSAVEDTDRRDRAGAPCRKTGSIVEDLTAEGQFGESREDRDEDSILVHDVEDDAAAPADVRSPAYASARQESSGRRSEPVLVSFDREGLRRREESSQAGIGVPSCRDSKEAESVCRGGSGEFQSHGGRDASIETVDDSRPRPKKDGPCGAGPGVEGKGRCSEDSSQSRPGLLCRYCGALFGESLVLRRHIQCCIRDPSRLRGRSDLAPVSSPPSSGALDAAVRSSTQ